MTGTACIAIRLRDTGCKGRVFTLQCSLADVKSLKTFSSFLKEALYQGAVLRLSAGTR